MKKFSILNIRKFLENKKDIPNEWKILISYFNHQILDNIINLFFISNDYTEFNELLIILINLSFIDDDILQYFIKDNIICTKLYNIFNNTIQDNYLNCISENIILILSNFISKEPILMENILNSIPFQNVLLFIIKNIKNQSNNITNIFIWLVNQGIKNIQKIFINLVTEDLIEIIIKKAEFYIEEETCYEAIKALETISFIKDTIFNKLLLKNNILEISLKYINKNYDFELTTLCYSILYNLAEFNENDEIMFSFFSKDIFTFSTDCIVIDLNENFEKYNIVVVKRFLNLLIKIFKYHLISKENIFHFPSLYNNAIQINILLLIKKISSDFLIYNYLRYIKSRLKEENNFNFPLVISLGFFEFLLDIVFVEFQDDLEIILVGLEIIMLLFDKEKKYKHKFIAKSLVKNTSYSIIDNFRSNINDEIAEIANHIYESI